MKRASHLTFFLVFLVAAFALAVTLMVFSSR